MKVFFKHCAFVLMISLVVIAVNSILSKNTFDSYFPHLEMDKVFLTDYRGEDGDISSSLKQSYTNDEVIPLIVAKADLPKALSTINKNYLERYSIIDVDSIFEEAHSNTQKGFSTSAPLYGKQSLCLITYTPDAVFVQEGRWKRLEDNAPSSIPLFRMSVLHELEHCITPRWVLQAAAHQIAEADSQLSQESQKLAEKLVEKTLQEAYADLFPLVFTSRLPEYALGHEALISFRNVLSTNNSGNLGYYSFNQRVNTAFANQPFFLPNTDFNRLRIIKKSLTHLPMPTESEIYEVNKKGS
jgi:hypothetical protein